MLFFYLLFYFCQNFYKIVYAIIIKLIHYLSMQIIHLYKLYLMDNNLFITISYLLYNVIFH